MLPIPADRIDTAFVSGKPTYVVIYSEGFLNFKRTVGLYQFVISDIDQHLSREQKELEKIPNVVVLDASACAVYNHSTAQ